jgi:hypothetical protein
VEDLELVLGDLKDVAKELKEVSCARAAGADFPNSRDPTGIPRLHSGRCTLLMGSDQLVH